MYCTSNEFCLGSKLSAKDEFFSYVRTQRNLLDFVLGLIRSMFIIHFMQIDCNSFFALLSIKLERFTDIPCLDLL